MNYCSNCNNLQDKSQLVLIDQTYTTNSNTLLKDYMIRTLENNELYSEYICTHCFELFNELDLTEQTCTKIRNQIIERRTVVDKAQEELISEEKTEEKKIYECKECNKKYVSKNGYLLHTRRKHNAHDEEEEPAARPVGKDDEFEKRKVKKLKPLKYSCPHCKKMWKTLSELRNHVASHSSLRPYICEICGQAYKHKAALNIHVGMHNGIHPFSCKYCSKTFTQKGALQRHLPIHTGEAPYQCDLCGKRFVHHTSFNMHTLAHTGQKSYKCTVCGLALLSGSHLKRHMRVHTGERPFACTQCGKRFAERYNLAAHQRLHESGSAELTKRRNHTHKCQLCGVAFDRKPKLEEHLSVYHNKISETQDPKWLDFDRKSILEQHLLNNQITEKQTPIKWEYA